eukprot:361767-Chlamydomonas_euryale.AAC.5
MSRSVLSCRKSLRRDWGLTKAYVLALNMPTVFARGIEGHNLGIGRPERCADGAPREGARGWCPQTCVGWHRGAT